MAVSNVDESLRLVKLVRKGQASLAALSESLKLLTVEELIIFSDLARMRSTMVEQIKSMASLLKK